MHMLNHSQAMRAGSPLRMGIIEPPPGRIGAQITDLDVRALEPDAPELQQIRELIYRHRLVTLRNQELSAEEYVAFTYKLGNPQIYFQPQYHHPDHPEIFVSSNVLENGRKVGVKGTGRYWHTDCQFEPKPLSFTSIMPQILPRSARQTFYIDMAGIYRCLPDELRDLVDGRTAVHEAQVRYKIQESDVDVSLRDLLDRMNYETPPARHPAVITHPVTGEEILYLSSGFTTRLLGYTHEENRAVMARLFEFIERDAHIQTHYWEAGDLIIWDNRLLIHKASAVPPGEQSKSYRIGIYDGLPFYAGLQP